MLKQRLMTALVMILCMLWLMYWAPVSVFLGCMAIITAIAGWEWARLVGLQSFALQLAYAILVAVLGVAALQWLSIAVMQWLLAGNLLLWLINILQVFRYQGQLRVPGEIQVWPLVTGVLILPAAMLGIVQLHDMATLFQGKGEHLLLVLLFLIWTADSGAYFAGRRFGRRKLAAKVSPGKSWEGVWGAMFAVLLVAGLTSGYLFDATRDRLLFVGVAILGVIVSIFGDLYESLLKRQVGQKDSSQILPGHGGVLDRVDSLVSAMPFYYLCLLLFGRAA